MQHVLVSDVKLLVLVTSMAQGTTKSLIIPLHKP